MAGVSRSQREWGWANNIVSVLILIGLAFVAWAVIGINNTTPRCTFNLSRTQGTEPSMLKDAEQRHCRIVSVP